MVSKLKLTSVLNNLNSVQHGMVVLEFHFGCWWLERKDDAVGALDVLLNFKF
jgi:hypothetical protein